MPTLHHLVQTAPGATPTHWAWMLHGILGSGLNLRSVARRLCTDRPDWGFILPDLRNHGESHGFSPPHTLAACAADLDALADSLGLAPRLAIGHSFGGKVALVWASAAEAGGRTVDSVWALDVPPGRPDRSLAANSEVVRVVAALRSLPLPFPRRESVVSALSDRGFSLAIAAWMTTNVRPGEGGFVWRFDLDGIEAMLHAYAETDAWPWLESPARRARVDVVRAGRSERWSPAELARFAAPNLHLHVLENAGHWVHVDDPDGLHRLLAAGLTPAAP